MDSLIELQPLLWEAAYQTVYIVALTLLFGGVGGLLLGLALYLTRGGALFQNRETRLNDEVSRVCCFALRGLGGFDLQNRSAKGFMNGPETMRATAIFLSAGGPFGIMGSGFTMWGS